MTILFEGTLPYPPSVNHYWHHVGSGKDHRVYIAAKGRVFIEHVKLLVKAKNSTKRIAAHFEICPPDRRTRDIDNLSKGLLDALGKAHLYADDGQIDDLRLVRGPIVPKGCVNAVIWEIEE